MDGKCRAFYRQREGLVGGGRCDRESSLRRSISPGQFARRRPVTRELVHKIDTERFCFVIPVRQCGL